MRVGRTLGLLLVLPGLLWAQTPNPELRAVVQRENGKRYLHIGRLEQAVNAFQQSLVLNPRDPETAHRLGTTYFRLREIDAACQYWNQACGLNDSWCRGQEFTNHRKLCTPSQ